MILKEKSMMIVLSSPSGAGKTTLARKLQKNNSNFYISISYTTRQPRPNEVNGKDYYFVSRLEFEKLIQNKSFYEYATIFENYYGTPKEPVVKLLSSGKDILFDIDWQGTQQLKLVKNLPLLKQTNNVYEETKILPAKEKSKTWWMGDGKVDRAIVQKKRSKFFTGIASAMADQWGRKIESLLQMDLLKVY